MITNKTFHSSIELIIHDILLKYNNRVPYIMRLLRWTSMSANVDQNKNKKRDNL